MLPASWKPLKCANLARMGSAADGGYVVNLRAIDASNLLISMGLSDNWDFEAAFRERTRGRVISLDHTVNSRFWLKHALASLLKGQPAKLGRYFAYRRFFDDNDVQHRLLKVGYDVDGGTSLGTLLGNEPGRSTFLKADIEGSEYRIFDDIVANADKLTGIAIELHDIDLHRARIEQLFAKLDEFEIVALAANNFGGVDAIGDPLVVEVTLIHRSYMEMGDPGALLNPVANDPRQPSIEPRFASAG